VASANHRVVAAHAARILVVIQGHFSIAPEGVSGALQKTRRGNNDIKMKLSIKAVLVGVLSVGLQHAAGFAAPADTGDGDALMDVTHDLCDRQIVMLGESATHGDARAETFKVALVERLVNECGFDSVFFEASHYEFLNIARRFRTGQTVSVDQVSSAAGGLWKFDQEFQPLVPFLLARAQAGQISLGGIDDQSGEMGQDYANVEMVTELTGFLPLQQRQDCRLALHRRIYSDYTKDAPYSKSDRSQITTCLADIQHTVAADRTTELAGREEKQEMVSAVQRWIGRDFTSDAEWIVERDRSMFQNFEWLRRQQSRRHKVILWAATVHIAKQGDPAWADHTGKNFGSYVHQEYGTRAFSLGFSALTGSYRQGRRDVHPMPAAPPDSLEAQALRGSGLNAVYVGSAHLAAMGTLPGAIFRHSYQTLPWANLLDGVVIFREERPPISNR
jgi:erythromycin esterase-like protein